MLGLLPGLNDHHCSLGRPGGFVQRLQEGTYFGHVVEHVAIELCTLADVGANHGKTRQSGERRVYNIAIEYKAEKGCRYLLEAAVRLVESVLRSEPFELGKAIREAKEIARHTELGPSTRAIITAAEKRNIPWRRKDEESLFQLGYGANLHHIRAAMTDRTALRQSNSYRTKKLPRRCCSGRVFRFRKGRWCGRSAMQSWQWRNWVGESS